MCQSGKLLGTRRKPAALPPLESSPSETKGESDMCLEWTCLPPHCGEDNEEVEKKSEGSERGDDSCHCSTEDPYIL